jgi:GntR family transcriptional regulator / MocR family aminotransferase
VGLSKWFVGMPGCTCFCITNIMHAMKKVATGFVPVIAVNRRAPKPLQRQIYDAYRAAIIRRSLRSGQQIPSTRSLACELGISRIPALNAYAQLLAEGYFETRAGAGTFVSTALPDREGSTPLESQQSHAMRSGPRPIARRAARLPAFKPAPWLYGWGAFSVGQVAFDKFPLQIWSQLVARHSRIVSPSALHFSDPMGSRKFRETIATYLRTVRGVSCEAEQIMVVSGSQQALEISARALLDPGNQVWVEEPGYRLTRDVLLMAGCQLIPVPVDDEGLDVAEGIQRCESARAAYVTPTHQFPLGATMSASRRLQLLNWAQVSGAWIIEDDYDSEYRYVNMPIPSLQGLDRDSRVIYIGTFSKTLFPSLRLGYMVVPLDLVDRFLAVRHAMDIYPPYLYQSVLTDFIRQGHFSRHIRRTKVMYRDRRSKLVEALGKQFGSALPILGAEAGMHLVVMLPKGQRDTELAGKAAREKLWLWPLSPCYSSKNAHQGFILGFGSATEREIPAAVRRLEALLKA